MRRSCSKSVSTTDHRWAKENIHFWRRDYRAYLEYFFSEAFPEAHSTKQFEDGVGWGLETDPESLAATKRAPPTVDPATFAQMCASIRAPALVIQGTDERLSHVTQGVGLAQAIPGARLELIEAAGTWSTPGTRSASTCSSATSFERFGGGPPMRAREPDVTGTATSGDGVRIAYETFGTGDPTIVMLPSTPIIHSRQWKAQVPYLARHFRVVTYDGRGNGRSDRPTDVASYAGDRYLEDPRAVMDATATERAVLVGLCGDAVWPAVQFAARWPDRVLGIVAFAVGVPLLTPPHPWRVQYGFHDELETDEGWAKLNEHYWRRDYPGFVRFFFGELTSEPHSTKVLEDIVGWALDGSVDAMLAEGSVENPWTLEAVEAVCRDVRCPLLIVHGTNDHCQPVSRAHRLAELTGGRLVIVDGADHLIPGRHPVLANLLIRDFVRSMPEGVPA